ncbi:hypothetical protein DSM14862_01629 [Sulfitobacter indolifex]|uniref:DUF1499 domain-containing protein n=1 Tax=Sulfitobacter indolifex HEL-45 TaxID=391624 RepID=A0ABP2D935_9RHOB|nr:DUF1499 domain-containing protein [Sulfitobacter indolifex]EDQ04755.1 hypothetical protein OIHEL45_13680 [Sulfitobacter indolifex HEL-45]UOA18848.1 hypothetical protein DSM14862_01629 [Sulfitobacter indolifex]
MLFWIIVIALVALVAYVRLAPLEPARWHVQAEGQKMGKTQAANSYIWRDPVEDDGAETLAKLDRTIMQTPRTEVVAGSLAEGQVTYVTRTKLMGYPDFTTIGVYGADPRYVEVYGRSRFGRSDLGVNAKRVNGWLAQIEAR